MDILSISDIFVLVCDEFTTVTKLLRMELRTQDNLW
jgi:hypothetical protein